MRDNYAKWCEQLLDTGRSNKLINYKDSGLRTLEVISPDADTIFSKLSSGSTLSFYDVDEYLRRSKNDLFFIDKNGENSDNNIENSDINEENSQKKVFVLSKSQVLDLLGNKIRASEILAYKKGYTLKKILNTITKVAKESLVEKGINILYAAFGFLRWKESPDSDIWLTSPLNLIPIKLENQVATEPYFLSQYEDEVATNPTLTYRLKTDFGIDLPAITDDISLSEHLDTVQKIVQNQGWEVVAGTAIGTFSFHKLNMYNDLKDNQDSIIRHQNVVRLLGGEAKSADQAQEIDIDIDIDEFFKQSKETELHNVVDADSSQIEAIVKAKTGKNMVLQGPPGTGKSQTITNLIAEFLHDGKKILFVSEKNAALKVVFGNLEKAGLSDFCLQLHSNKTNKHEVIAELYRTLNLSRQTPDVGRIDEEIASLMRSKQQLDDYVRILHRRQEGIDRSPYEILGAVSRYHDAADFEFALKNIEKKGADYLLDAMDAISDFKGMEQFFSADFRQSCFWGYNNPDASFKKKTETKNLMREVRDFLEPMCELAQDYSENFGLDAQTKVDIDRSAALLKVIGGMTFFDSACFSLSNLKTAAALAQEMAELEKGIAERRESLLKQFESSIFDLDISALYRRFLHDYSSGMRFLNSGFRKDKKLVRSNLISPKTKLGYKEICGHLKTARECLSLAESLAKAQTLMFKIIDKSALDVSWQTVSDDLTALKQVLTRDQQFFMALSKDEFFRIQPEIKNKAEVFDSFNQRHHSLAELQKDYDKNLLDFESFSMVELLYKMEQSLSSFDELFDYWLKFIGIFDRLKALEIYDFVIASIDAEIPVQSLDKTYKKMFYTQWFLFLMNNSPVLSSFGRLSQDKAVANFKEKDRLKFSIAKSQIVSKLSSMRPIGAISASGGQVNLLQREALKKRKQMPVRVLLKSIPELVLTLKPCFMMSPLSVSTYLGDDKVRFDVVIFDEASQIFPWDAVGSIYRAEQIIVVGDSKQMPPSNFFCTGVVDDGDEDDFEDDALDFESILDLCAATFDQTSLRWHYRSRVEELISFSNHNFYQDSLVSFPSNRHGQDDGVSFHYVADGIFDRKSKNNVKEAEKIVELIYKHFEAQPDRSLGVVAFSKSQQDTIGDVLQKRREQDDRFAKFFDDSLDEPFFIKNLETIQGDERDTIIFSVGYAKDLAGKFLHNFGPLNNKGGERRLNVAVTRAKYNVKLVASIKSYDIDLSKTQADGARMLKNYLDFAERGVISLDRVITTDSAQPDSQFELEVFDVLKSAGHDVKIQVGCSGYKIDLAVRHPHKDEYVLAIECDGASYHSGKTTRDRDRLRQEVLERLGWTFYRIWSTDWFRNKAIERRKLLENVEDAIKNFDRQLEKDADFLPPSPPLAAKSEESFAIESDNAEQLRDLFIEYKEADIDALIKKHFKKSFDRCAFLEEVIKTEQPIMEELLLKRVAVAFGREKVTSVVRAEFALEAKNSRAQKIKGYWTTDAGESISLRIPPVGQPSREIPLICKEEIADGFLKIIKYNIGITKDGLFKTLVNLLGFTRAGDNIIKRLDEALNLLLVGRKIKEKDGAYFLV